MFLRSIPNPVGIGLITLSILVLLYTFWLVQPPITLMHSPLSAPSTSHWLGTDSLGQDILHRLLQATPNTLLLALSVGIFPILIALIMASVAVIGGKWCDRFILKLTDVLITLPSILIIILLAVLIEPDFWGLILILVAVAWMDDLRVLRTTMQREQQRESIETAKSYGATSMYLLRMHLWPRLWSLLPALFVQNARRAVLQSAGLSFLGLTDPRLPSWGNLLQEAQTQIHSPAFWWLLIPPLLALALLLYGISRLDQVTESTSQKNTYYD